MKPVHIVAVVVVFLAAVIVASGPTLFARRAEAPTPTPAATVMPMEMASPVTVSGANAQVEVVFTQAAEHPDTVLSNDILATRYRLDAAFYAINRPVIIDAIVMTHKRCGCVRLISDAVQSGLRDQAAALTSIHQAGVPIKVDSHAGIMHMKMAIIDGSRVDEGSFNATNAASTINDEVLFRIESSEIAGLSHAEFDVMWTDSRRFRDWPTAVVPSPSSLPQF